MSGPLGSSQWMYSSGGFYPYEIEQSLRFNDDDSAYLSWTPASAGNRKTWTWSGWVKRGNLGATKGLFEARISATELTSVVLNSDGLNIQDYNGGSHNLVWASTALFRDPSAWYHVVVSFDTTQATSAAAVKAYVNGAEVALGFTAFTGAYVQNRDTFVNSAIGHSVGRYNAANYFDGYMAEVNFVDGTALDPTSFGEFKSGVWIPKKYTGSYGTNGFYLSFADSAAIGDDLSGNGNDWTPSGLASTDVLLDSPTNNYAVLNPLFKNSTMILSDGNLRANGGAATYPLASTIVTPETGKWYAEFTVVSNDGGGYPQVGLVDLSTNFNSNIPLHATKGVAYSQNGNVYRDGSSVSSGAGTFTTGDVIGVAYDADTREVWFSKNNVWVLSGDPAAGTSPAVTANAPVAGYAFGVSAYNAANVACNFGQSAFTYTPPDGFLALNTANLPEPTITPALDDVPADYFNTVLWTGDGVSPSSITGVGFQPDLLWTKARSVAYDGLITDAVRGAGKSLTPSSTAAEVLNNGNGYHSSFDTDGFTLTQGASSIVSVNQSGQTYVAWNWKAAGAGVSNTDGTISSTVSANQKAGFSIVSYTGTGATGTFGHGLGVAPKMVIIKDRTSGTRTVSQWPVYHASVGPTKAAFLNVTDTPFTQITYYNNTAPDASVVTVGSWGGINFSGDAFIAYCFAEVEGYSKFGSYTGNGAADGPFVYCGFRPAFIMVKRTDTAESWVILDAARDPDNVVSLILLAESSVAEVGSASADFLSNGFKLRVISDARNASGGTYIFMAFAEAPFKYANAR